MRSAQAMTCGDEGGRSKAGKPCGQTAGWGTDHVGSGKCRKHFGTTRRENEKAQEQRAQQACETLGIPHEGIKPEHALLAELWECLGNIDFYRRQAQVAVEQDALVAPTLTVVHKPNGGREITRGPARESVWLRLYERERDRLRAIAEAMLRAGVDERRVQLAEADAALAWTGIVGAFTVMGLEERLDEFRQHFAAALQAGHGSLPRRAVGAGAA